MSSGSRTTGVIPTYPDGSVQSFLGEWWLKSEDKSDLGRGRLVETICPYVDLAPKRLTPEGRSDPKGHDSARYAVAPYRVGASRDTNRHLPVAGLPEHPGEVWLLQRAKRRPAIIVGDAAPAIVHSKVASGSPRSQTNPTLLLAPYYGAENNEKRAGWNPKFTSRIQACEYPQYMVDFLPLPGATMSVLRLDHCFSIGRHHDYCKWTPYRLCDEALRIFDDWFDWFRLGTLNNKSDLQFLRSSLGEL